MKVIRLNVSMEFVHNFKKEIINIVKNEMGYLRLGRARISQNLKCGTLTTLMGRSNKYQC